MGLSGEIRFRLVRVVTRGGVVAATGAVLIGGVATPAAAHTRAQAATDFSSRITATPDLPGVQWRVYAGGEYLELTNDSATEIVVTGYDEEPYLKVGPDGVFTNRNSPATYLNTERYGDVATPPRADPAAPPEWSQVSSSPTYAWHDHRAHWMSAELPPVVADAPRKHHHISNWAVPFTADGTAYEVGGSLDWVPGPAWWPWVLTGVVLTAPALLGVVKRKNPGGLVRPAALTVAVVAAFNAVHFVDELMAWPAPTLDVLFGLLHTALFIGAALIGAAVAWHGRYGPYLSLGIGSGAVLFHQGLLQLKILGASQLPTVWPDTVLRLAVAASLGQAIVVTAVIVTGLRTASDDAVTPPVPANPATNAVAVPPTRSTA